VWLYFDARLLVEIERDQARTLVDLAEQVGMFAAVRPTPSNRASRQLRSAVRDALRRFRSKEVPK
jgi:D-aminopeptidase